MIVIMPGVRVPDNEIEFVASRSGGPGGQNVNKVSSKVTLRFNLDSTSAFNAEQRQRIRTMLASRISKDGILQISSQRTRSQEFNREDVIARFVELIQIALHEEKTRVKTRATRAAKEERLKEKKKRTSVKQTRALRGSRAWDE